MSSKRSRFGQCWERVLHLPCHNGASHVRSRKLSRPLHHCLFFLLLWRLTVLDIVVAISAPSSGEFEDAFGLGIVQGGRLALEVGSTSIPLTLPLGSDYDGPAAFVLSSSHHGAEAQVTRTDESFQSVQDVNQSLQAKVPNYPNGDNDPLEYDLGGLPLVDERTRRDSLLLSEQQLLDSSLIERTPEDSPRGGNWPGLFSWLGELEGQHRYQHALNELSMASVIEAFDHNESGLGSPVLIAGAVVVVLAICGAFYCMSLETQSRLSSHKSSFIQVVEDLATLWPEKLVVEDPSNKLAGTYWVVAGRKPNGMPLWQLENNKSLWIFCGSGGQWFIGDEDEEKTNFDVNTGLVASIQEHGGRMPDEIGPGGWLYFDGEEWKEEEGFNITSDLFTTKDHKKAKGNIRDAELLEVTADESTADLGLSFTGMPPKLVTVRKVCRRSWGHTMQILVGDEVIAVNGVAVPSMTAAMFQKAMTPAARPVTLKIRAPSFVTFKMKVEHVSFEVVTSNETLAKAFEDTIKQSVATEAGSGVQPKHIDLELWSGSIIVKVEITPPLGILATTIQTTVGKTVSLAQTVIRGLNQMPDLQQAKSGNIKIIDVSKPEVVCLSQEILRDAAAAQIQALARGNMTRRAIAQARANPVGNAQYEVAKKEGAATKIQAARRGSQTRKDIQQKQKGGWGPLFGKKAPAG